MLSTKFEKKEVVFFVDTLQNPMELFGLISVTLEQERKLAKLSVRERQSFVEKRLYQTRMGVKIIKTATGLFLLRQLSIEPKVMKTINLLTVAELRY